MSDDVLHFLGVILCLWATVSLFTGPFTSGRLAISVLLFVAGVVVWKWGTAQFEAEMERKRADRAKDEPRA